MREVIYIGCADCAYCSDGLLRDTKDNICCVCLKMPSNDPAGCGYMEIDGIDHTKDRMWFCPLSIPETTNETLT